ncbi:MAG: uroporphyrinogen-III C-methyltransferase [candidate division NC10 bacterium]|nr:uroporphyrinogen-III C-methyltransferase [candidate division NC10 bacterium]MDE2322746.1 uroporphyrinogen-III C-methyltransferase [candidate division NC10 bacterium]
MGKVYLIGAGPGDPGLFTLRGVTCLREADVIVYDYLANPRLLSYARPDAELIYVGKKGGNSDVATQAEIDRLLIEKALTGKVVARLKGGDPFIFGRGGEEGEELFQAGIPFEVVPGITSAIAVPAYAGIPLTHRDYTSSVAILTGHEDPSKQTSLIAWEKVATGIGTLVFLMGCGNLPTIVDKLLEYGRSKDTPAAVMHWGTKPEQETVAGTLENIVALAQMRGLGPPAVLVVGDVVRLRERLNWFERRPLFGKRILVTRTREQAGRFAELLEGQGAEVVEVPLIEIVPPKSWKPMDQAIERLEAYGWVIFTSVNGVDAFFRRLREHRQDARRLGAARICAIGSATADTLERHNIIPDIVPAEFRAEGVIEALTPYDLQGAKILLPRAEVARDLLPIELERRGATVEVVPVYRTVRSPTARDLLKPLLQDRKIDLVTFTSSSTVTNFVEALAQEDLKTICEGVRVACIGPITKETAERFGLTVDIMPQQYTIPTFAAAIADYFSA